MLMLSAVGTSPNPVHHTQKRATARLLVCLFVKFLSRKSPHNSKTACQEFGASLLLYCFELGPTTNGLRCAYPAIHHDLQPQPPPLREVLVVNFTFCGDFCGDFHYKSKSPQVLVVVFTIGLNHHKYLW